MTGPGRTLPLFLGGLLLLAVGAAWTSIEAGAYLPRFILLSGFLLLAWSLVRHAAELRLLLVQARSFSEPGPTTTMLLLALVLVLAALLGGRLLVPLDLTAERLNSLSRASRTALAALPGTVRLEGFFANPSPEWDRAERFFALYEQTSRRVETELIDPERDPARARAAGAERSRVIVASSGESRAEVYELSEEAITQGILRVLEGRPRWVAFLQGHGEPPLASGGDEGLSAWAEALRGANVEPRELVLLESAGVPDEVEALVIVRPRHALYPHEVALIGRFIEHGGRLGIWIEPGDSTGLEPYLERIYLRVLDGTIRDEGRVSAGLGLGPWVTALVGDPRHPLTAGLGTFGVAPQARPLEVVSPHPADLTVVPVMKTTGAVEIFARPDEPGARPSLRGVATVVAVAQWPVAVGADWRAGADARGLPPLEPEARVLVSGDASMVTNRFLGMGSNLDLAVGGIHWLTEQQRFLDIARERSRPAEMRVGPRGLKTLLYLVEFALPLGFAILGAVVWMRRRAG